MPSRNSRELCILDHRRRSTALAIEIDPAACSERLDGEADDGGVDLVEAVADGASRTRHDGARQLARVIVKEAFGLQIGSRHCQRGGEIELEGRERVAPQRPAKSCDRWLADAGAARQFGNRHAGCGIIVRMTISATRRSAGGKSGSMRFNRDTMSIAAALRGRLAGCRGRRVVVHLFVHLNWSFALCNGL